VKPQTDRNSLSEAATVLSRLLGDPDRLRDDEAAESLKILNALAPDPNRDYLRNPTEFMREWNEEVCPSFSSPGALALEESVYKPWTTDKLHPLSEERGLAWGDPAEHMLSLFEIFGLNAADRRRVPPDHLSMLLNFLALLLESRPENEVAHFCRDHLDWLSELVKAAQNVGAPAGLVLAVRAAESLVELVASKEKRSEP
jgi:hypothetical protein